MRVTINAETLQWAREVAHLSLGELASTAGVSSPERVAAFETGEADPTYRQLVAMAKKLDRPLAFFLAPPPAQSDVPEAVDFRAHGGELPPLLLREMKRAEEHRDALLDLTGPPEVRIELPPVKWDNLAEAARHLRAQFGLTPEFRPPSSQPNQVLHFWRGLLEQHGVLVFQSTGIEYKVFRGLSLNHPRLPVILLNGADSPNGKVFTLFHELAHLSRRTNGLCLLHEQVHEETLANRFAAEVLMPSEAVDGVLADLSERSQAAQHLARTFRVSELAAAIRLQKMGWLTESDVDEVRERGDAAWERAREAQRNRAGFVPGWQLRYRDLGKHYVGAVAEALEAQRINLLDVTYLLDARLPTAERMLDEYYRGGASDS